MIYFPFLPAPLTRRLFMLHTARRRRALFAREAVLVSPLALRPASIGCQLLPFFPQQKQSALSAFSFCLQSCCSLAVQQRCDYSR